MTSSLYHAWTAWQLKVEAERIPKLHLITDSPSDEAEPRYLRGQTYLNANV